MLWWLGLGLFGYIFLVILRCLEVAGGKIDLDKSKAHIKEVYTIKNNVIWGFVFSLLLGPLSIVWFFVELYKADHKWVEEQKKKGQ